MSISARKALQKLLETKVLTREEVQHHLDNLRETYPESAVWLGETVADAPSPEQP